MNRRDFLTSMATKAAGGAVLGLAAGCSFSQTPAAQDTPTAVAQDDGLPEISWQMATSWPVSLDTIFGGAQVFAEAVSAMTGGKFKKLGGGHASGAGRGNLGGSEERFHVRKRDGKARQTRIGIGKQRLVRD